MLKRSHLLLWLLAVPAPLLLCAQQPADPIRSEITQWMKKNTARNDLAQKCSPLTGFKNWESVELKDCTYRYPDTGPVKGFRDGHVYLIIPPADRIADWIVNGCADAKGKVTESCARAAACQIKIQSGAQFPVAGIVWEDMDGTGLKSFPFRDGVTVQIDGVPYRSPDPLTPDQLKLSLDPNLGPRLLKTASLAGPARIQGTPRTAYLKSGGKQDVTGLKWLDVVRSTFQEALKSDRNELMTDWIRAQSDAALDKQLNDAARGHLCVF